MGYVVEGASDVEDEDEDAAAAAAAADVAGFAAGAADVAKAVVVADGVVLTGGRGRRLRYRKPSRRRRRRQPCRNHLGLVQNQEDRPVVRYFDELLEGNLECLSRIR